MLLLNRTFVPSPPKGRKHRGGSANVETVFARTPRENIARGRRETVAESSPARDVSSRQGAAAFFQIKKAPFSRSLFAGINHSIVPSPSKGRKRRGGSANIKLDFARTPRENIARGRRETVAESSPARDVSPGQGAAAFFQMKEAPFSRSLFVGINRTFVPSLSKGRKRRGDKSECRDGFRPIEARRRRNSRAISRRSNEEPAETGRQAPQTPRRFCPTQYPTESGSGTRTISAPSARSLFSKLA